MSARRILLWSEALVFGGHEVMAIRLAEGLSSRHGWEIAWCVHPSNQELIAALSPQQAIIRQTKEDSISRRFPLFALGRRCDFFRKLVSRWQPQVVCLVQGWPTAGITPLLVPCDVPIVSYVPLFPAKSSGIRSFAARWWARTILSRASRVITVSMTLAEHLSSFLPQPALCVENWVQPALPQKFPPSQEPVLAIIGRLDHHQKGHDILLPALACLRASGMRFRLRIVGIGPDEAMIRSLTTSLQLDDRVDFAGWLPTAQAFTGVHLVLMPSRFEGSPLVAIEAALRHIPVVGSDIPGLSGYLLDECVVPDLDPSAWAERIRMAMESEIWNRAAPALATLAQQVADRHDANRSIDRFATIFQSVIAGQRCA